jgi:tRNA dimethylallyltransferase
MVESGAIEEVRSLLERELDPSLSVMRAIGVREIAAFLDGEIGRGDMIARGSQATRNYAKRQYTWFAHQPPADWPRFMRPLDESTLRDALALLEPKT